MKLALGTAQFGLDYGIANQSGRVPADEVQQILQLASLHQIDTLDTAIAYGESERVLGQSDVSGWRVISKLPAVPTDCADLDGWVEQCVTASLSRLGIDTLDGLLLHQPMQLLEPVGERLSQALCGLQTRGLVYRLGVSVYDFDALGLMMARLPCGLIQVPFSILDQRLVHTGWSARLRAADVEIHARSVFLQGLLVMPPAQRPTSFHLWSQTFADWDQWLYRTGLSPLEACLRFALTSAAVDKVVVGIDSLAQLRQLLTIEHLPLADLPTWQSSPPSDLINPSCWNTL
jgi:aryl-alcohol dehydrogenase-like predicted oxidoreductase